jgi:signal peptidase I
MAKKNKQKSSGSIPLPVGRKDEPAKPTKPVAPLHPSHSAARETFEALATAFILAFIARTFIVEPFVIPTGSMSPALMGVHKDLDCPQCGERYRVNASVQSQIRGQMAPDECIGGMCPMCRYAMAYDDDVAKQIGLPRQFHVPDKSQDERSYSGDRIIVNKFLYSFTEPERWDVVVFKYPGNATDNYIKRLVGLPEETLKIFGGDLFVMPDAEEDFTITRRPPRTLYAMREAVHDTDRDPANLHEAGWPLRWQVGEGWQVEESTVGNRLKQSYSVSGEGEHWLRYVHTPPTNAVWPSIERGKALPQPERELISDFNPYNTRITPYGVGEEARRGVSDPFIVPREYQGLHWVGDLYVEVDVEAKSGSGELLLELVEAGNKFRATIDLATGKATLSIRKNGESTPVTGYAPTANTSVSGAGKHHVMFANVDDQLLLWVDDKVVKFDSPTEYNWDTLFGPRREATPQTSDEDPGDLAPARVGAVNADLVLSRLRVYRDIYYIAARDVINSAVTDLPPGTAADVLSNPEAWRAFANRNEEVFPIAADQFFVMGDNSPQSSDARLWNQKQTTNHGNAHKPGGNYLERQLLVGRAISVVWPHPWDYVIPSFTDMRRIE